MSNWRVLLWTGLGFLSAAPAGKAANLVPNSSFELGGGPHGVLLDRHWYAQGGLIAREGVDAPGGEGTPVAAHGKVAAGASVHWLASAAFPIPHPGRPHVLSFSLRANPPQQIQVRIGGNPADSNHPTFTLSQPVSASQEWQRFALPGVIEGGVEDLYYLQFDTGGGPFWVDAVQLEEGTQASDYAPARPVEFGLFTDRPHHVFEPGEPLAVTVQAYNNENKPATAHLELLVKDFRDRVVTRQELPLSIAPSGLTEQEVQLPPLRRGGPGGVSVDVRGSVRLELYQAGGPVVDELVAAIMPKVPEEDRGAGSQQPISDPTYVNYLGIKYVAGEVVWWDWVQPEGPDQWDWSRPDEIVPRCLAQGLTFRAVWLLNTPQWAAQKEKKNRPWPSAENAYFDLDDWERYVYEVARRYRGRIDSWSVWNEPWFADASQYIELLKVSREAIKRANPNAEVCGTDIPASIPSWMDQFLKLGGLSYLDALTSHSYGQGGGYLPESLAILPRWAKYDGQDRPVYNQETHLDIDTLYTFYTSVFPANTGSWRNPGGMVAEGWPAEEGAARWAKQFITNHALGVQTVMPHYIFVSRFPSFQSRGCPEPDGAWTPLASAWGVASRLISTAEPRGEVKGSPDLRLLLFHKRGTPTAVVWTREWEAGQYRHALRAGLFRKPDEAAVNRGIVRKIVLPEEHDLTLVLEASQFVAYDLMGNEIPPRPVEGGATVLPVSRDPLYLVARQVDTEVFRQALEGAEVAGRGSVDLQTTFATSRSGRPGLVARLTSKRGRAQEVQLTLTQAPEGLEFAETSRNVTVPARRSVEVVFEPARRPSLLSGGRGFRLIAQSAEGRTEVSQELWLAQSERFPAAPTLNGQLDEWTGHTAIALDQETQFEVGPNGWKGPDDLSAKVMTGWDADHLYVAFQINDAGDWVVSRSGGSGLYSYDAVELFLDLDVMGDLAVTDLGEDDRQLMIGPGSGDRQGEVVYFGGVEGLRGGWHKTEQGYNLEVALPWSNFIAYGAVGQAGTVIGFQPTVCDNDGPNVPWKKLAWTGFPEAYHNTSLWGRLVLVE